MHTTTPAFKLTAGLCLAACSVLSGPVQAGEKIVTVRLAVAVADLDLSRPSDARELYARLSAAAQTVCGNSLRVAARPLTDFASCFQHALGDAIRSANKPQLTMVYMNTHTLQDAANRGISVPILMAMDRGESK
jgi:UrcA family protein